MEIGRELLASLLFPRRCPVCDEILAPEEMQKGIHSACECKLYPIYGAVCMHCGRPVGEKIHPNVDKKFHTEDNYCAKVQDFGASREYCFDCANKGYTKKSFIKQAKSMYLYRDAIKISMYRFKYSNKREYADFFAKEAVKSYYSWMKHVGIEAIVPVPLHAVKKRRRGYNQAECFAVSISKHTQIPVRLDLVCRIVNTTPQKGLTSEQRKVNLKHAFQKGKSKSYPACILLVDDIYTTGSTAEAVAQVLMQQGVQKVYLLTICIGE